MVDIIIDVGSNHMGNLDLAKEHIRVAKECGANKAKFQLFKVSTINIPLPYKWFPDLVNYGKEIGIEVFASVFDRSGLDLVLKYCNSIKFAYSMNEIFELISDAIDNLKTVYVSYGVMNDVWDKTKSLYCIPEYPIKYKIDFDGIFERFEGFSSHCLGIRQDLEAIRYGAKIIEKHFILDDPRIDCPDAKFSITPPELERLVNSAMTYERNY